MSAMETYSGSITGTVFTKSPVGDSKMPINHARIEVFEGEVSGDKSKEAKPIAIVYSGADGDYLVSNLKAQKYTVRCYAFLSEPPTNLVQVGNAAANVAFEIDMQFQVVAPQDIQDSEVSAQISSLQPVRRTTFRAEHSDNVKISNISWNVTGGKMQSLPQNNREIVFFPVDGSGVVSAIAMDEAGAFVTANATRDLGDVEMSRVGWPVEVVNNIEVSKRRTKVTPTADVGLWAAIRDRTNAISFGSTKTNKGYAGFIEAVLCHTEGDKSKFVLDKNCEPKGLGEYNFKERKNKLPLHGVETYELLKTATEAFLLLNCGVAIKHKHDKPEPANLGANYYTLVDETTDRLEVDRTEVVSLLARYLDSKRLPYIQYVIENAFPGFHAPRGNQSVFCPNVLQRADCPCLLELIWSYWHEEGMLVQSMNAISRRFQNERAPGDRDPLAHLEIDPLRPLNNMLWGYVQDEKNLLSVRRRANEYLHHYGVTLQGKAVANIRSADTRSKFLESFHNLLHAAAAFFKEDNDTNYIAEGYPLLNALKEVHLVLSQGAHNQFGDLPWKARAEMLLQQWLISRPEMRDFLQSRAMVPYVESWMPQVDTMKTMQGWTDVSVTHFRDLGTYGEQLLLSIRYTEWIEFNDENHAKNWARHWRPEIQGYLHAYRAVTGVDLTNPEGVDYAMPTVHLQRRLASQRAR